MPQESFASNNLPPAEDIVVSTGPSHVESTPEKTSIAAAAEIPGAPKFKKRSVGNSIDKELLEETKIQIRSLVNETAELAKSDCSVKEFYEGFLMRTTSALVSVGGAIWVQEPEDKHLSLHYQINLKQTSIATDQEAQVTHTRLLNQLLESGKPSLVAPNSGSKSAEDGGNPTDYLLVVAPLIIDQVPVGLIEILQRPGSGPATQRGYLRFLTRMGTIASDFLKDRRLRSFSDQQSMWQKVEQFIKAVHNGLDPRQVAFTIANEGRRLIECDRVTVALANGNRMRVEAVSGLDTIERRAEQVKLLGRLASTVCKAGEPLWYSGDSSNLPPQIENRLHDYIDKSHTKMLAILPMSEPGGDEDNEETRSSKPPIGALIVEQLADARIESTTENRVAVVTDHGQAALSNALEHNSIFLMPVWKLLGKAMAPFRRSNLPKTFLVATILGFIGFALCVFPYSFSLSSNGQLIPTDKVDVFASLNGTLFDISVPDDAYATVEKGFVLATMTNNDLMVEIEQLDGELKQERENYRKFARAESQRGADKLDAILLAGERSRSEKKVAGLEKALTFKKQQAAELIVKSPIRGQVVNWQPRRTLLGRPVSRGQNLMTVVAPDTSWEIELEMPERRVGHLLNSQNEGEELSVNFSLVSNPGREFEGTVVMINRNLEVKSDDGNTVTVRVRFDNEQVPTDLLRAGTRVRAKVNCGTRSIGYVLFHELIETTRTNFMYWF